LTEGAYSRVADQQLDALEAGAATELYNTILDVCELIFSLTSEAQSRSTAISTSDGIRFRLAVPGHHPYKVFWSRTADGSRIEAVFPHP
jgi:hypothetical protein